MNRYFGDLEEKELSMLIEKCEAAVAEYTDEINVGMLSTASFNVYRAIQEAIRHEHAKARANTPIYRNP